MKEKFEDGLLLKVKLFPTYRATKQGSELIRSQLVGQPLLVLMNGVDLGSLKCLSDNNL